MRLKDFFKKKRETVIEEEATVCTKGTSCKKEDKPLDKKETATVEEVTATSKETPAKDATGSNLMNKIAPKEVGTLDMVIAFDTTGSMAAYIDDVRQQVADLIPSLFKDNKNIRVGIVAFGDYCDMKNAREFGNAYQVIQPTDNENDLVRFVLSSHNTSGGDGDEFYELVLKKIIDETPWREAASKVILLISDSKPHPLGYSYKDYVTGNQIDWRKEAEKAAEMKIRIDTVSIHPLEWYKELSAMSNGVNVPFSSSHKTSRMLNAAIHARGSMKARARFDVEYKHEMEGDDEEMKAIYRRYRREREDMEF